MKTHRKKEPCSWSDASTSPRRPSIAGTHQKLEEARKDSLSQPAEKAWFC